MKKPQKIRVFHQTCEYICMYVCTRALETRITTMQVCGRAFLLHAINIKVECVVAAQS